jgi:uncharacterized pyridoxal phosphate-containing UPF0001 family protein
MAGVAMKAPVEVNIGRKETKRGAALREVLLRIREVSVLENFIIQGLMYFGKTFH